MTYEKHLKNAFKNKVMSIIKHPYFGFLVIAALMLFIQLLRIAGVDIPISALRGFGKTMIYIIVGLGFSILLGYGGLASLGTAGFVGSGAYILGYFTTQQGYSVFLIIIITIIFAVILGTIIGFISLRIEGMYLAIITLAIAQIINEVFKNWTSVTNGNDGILVDNKLVIFNQFIQFNHNTIFIIIAVLLFFIMVVTFNIMKSPTGRALLTMRNSSSAAQAMGISIFKFRLLAFIISTIYAMFAGILYGSYFRIVTPTDWTLSFSLLILAAVIVGGSRSIYGIILGSFLVFGLDLVVLQNRDNFGGFFVEHPDITIMFNGLLIILVIMFYRGGLIRLVNTTYLKLKKLFTKYYNKWRVYRYGTDTE
ncbi:MAG: branched-chain amino acid ABC transporter permease [Candidatus Izimaplasma sp.]|nr:branched-chain amino acid ABC transporter permease [Candidatus Izimaplasma bacterium]